MLNNHMCCGIVGETFMGRVGPGNYQACLEKPFASEMDFTGKALKGMVYVAPEGIGEDHELQMWVDTCATFVLSLPPKAPKKRK